MRSNYGDNFDPPIDKVATSFTSAERKLPRRAGRTKTITHYFLSDNDEDDDSVSDFREESEGSQEW